MKTKPGKTTKSDFEKEILKLTHNAIFEKAMVNVRKNINI